MPYSAAGRVSRIVLGLHAAILAGVHGVFTLRQGPLAIEPPAVFSAIGPPCDPSRAWHACLPALTLAPDLGTAAALTLAAALLTALVTLLLPGRRAAIGLAAAAATLLLVGGGFVPSLTAALAAAVAAPIRTPHHRQASIAPSIRQPDAHLRSAPRLARAWPWALAAFVLWGIGGWWLGAAANDALLRLAGATFLLDVALPAAVVVTARARIAFERRP
jgi:hypothetical protein